MHSLAIVCKKMPGIKKSSLYKTEMCRSFEETGFCRYGTKCQFAHDLTELREVYRHPRYKTEVCKTFWEQGHCPYGKRCCFIHSLNANIQSISGQQSDSDGNCSPTTTTNLTLSSSMLMKESDNSFAFFPITPNSSMYDESWNDQLDDKIRNLPPSPDLLPLHLINEAVDDGPIVLTPFESSYSFDFANSDEFIELLEKKLTVLDAPLLQCNRLNRIIDNDSDYGGLDSSQCIMAAKPVFPNYDHQGKNYNTISCIGPNVRQSQAFNPFCNSAIYFDNLATFSDRLLPSLSGTLIGQESVDLGELVGDKEMRENRLLPDYLINNCLS